MSAMETVNLEQGSQEWLDYRVEKVGASEVANLFGENPFTKANDQTKYLLGLKLGFNNIFTNAAMRAGNDNEDAIIEYVEKAYDIVTQPLIGNVGKLSASFDGITMDQDLVVEVKYSDHTYNHIQKEQRPPEHYYLQVQQQLLVSGAEKAVFAAMNTKTREVEMCEVLPCPDTIYEIKKRVDEFFVLMDSKSWKEDDFNEDREDLDWLAAVEEYKEAKALETAAKAAMTAAKKSLIALSDGMRSSGGGATVYPVKGRESINYKQVIIDNDLEIDDKYKKTGAPSWSVRLVDK